VIGYRDARAQVDHVVLTVGEVDRNPEVPLRVHSECLTGEALASQRCDCGDQLKDAMAYIAARGLGVIVYLRGHEGRGIGLVNKLRAYAAQDRGADTVSANLALGLPVDAREYGAVGPILQDLGVSSVQLITNNPDKQRALERQGVPVRSRRPSLGSPTPENAAYLRTKRDVLGHWL
jgi:3,4-dihydroxy 2-butanone 4-phosphate synthase/GTP cyclohydrolase II